LIRGEAHFAVQKDAQRPFIVTAGDVEVRAVGTAFVIKLGANAVDVLVTEGRVAVDRAVQAASATVAAQSAEEPAVLADAGKRVIGTVDGAKPADFKTELIPPLEMERLLAWRGPKLELAGTPLAEAVAVFNRENQLQLIVGDSEVGEMRLSGVFRADNAEGFAQLLESHYGIVVERRGATALVLRKAR
jgi:transmembrane sensor